MKTIATANFVVIPTQFDPETEEVQGYSFTDASLATEFAKDVQDYGRKLYGKLNGLLPASGGKDATDDEKKALKDAKAKLSAVTQGLPFDVVIQPEEGDPMLMAKLRK